MIQVSYSKHQVQFINNYFHTVPIIDLRHLNNFNYETDLDDFLQGKDKFPLLNEVPEGSLVWIIHTVNGFKAKAATTFEHLNLSFNVWAVLVLTDPLVD